MKQKRYWLRGGILFIATYLIFSFFTIILNMGGFLPTVFYLLQIAGLPVVMKMVMMYNINNVFVIPIIIILNIIICFIIGSIAGYFYGKIKNRSNGIVGVLVIIIIAASFFVIVWNRTKQNFQEPKLIEIQIDKFDSASSWSGSGAKLEIENNVSNNTALKLFINDETRKSNTLAGVYKTILVPKDAQTMIFDYRFIDVDSKPSKGQLILSVNNQAEAVPDSNISSHIIYSGNSKDFNQSSPVVVGQYGGKEIRIQIQLNPEDGADNTEVFIDNLRFVKTGFASDVGPGENILETSEK